MIYATETPQAHLREARDIFKNMLKYSERVGRGNEQQGEREMKRGQTQTEFSMYVQAVLYFAVIHYSCRQEKLCEIFTMKSRQPSDVSVYFREGETALSHNNLSR